MSIWIAIPVLAVATIAVKTVGPLIAGGRQPPAAITRVIVLLGPTLMTALVVSNTFTHNQHLTVDARAAGVGVGLIALLLRAPLLLALVLAAVTCALVRLVT